MGVHMSKSVSPEEWVMLFKISLIRLLYISNYDKTIVVVLILCHQKIKQNCYKYNFLSA